jgi:hypothetical protein
MTETEKIAEGGETDEKAINLQGLALEGVGFTPQSLSSPPSDL